MTRMDEEKSFSLIDELMTSNQAFINDDTVIEHLASIAAECPGQTSLEEMPIRTIHHLSCTGGTLFAKCIASMPNVVILNEINPFSKMQVPQGKPPFTPTDIVALARQGEHSFASDELIKELFLDNLAAMRKRCWETGRILVLRDHSHSQFLFGDLDEDLPTLRDVIAERFPVLSMVTTRKPENAFASMVKQGWHHHFEPNTFEEYERRCQVFEKKFDGLFVEKYENLVSDPGQIGAVICQCLDLHFIPEFEDLFSSFRFSGDSGRGTSLKKIESYIFNQVEV